MATHARLISLLFAGLLFCPLAMARPPQESAPAAASEIKNIDEHRKRIDSSQGSERIELRLSFLRRTDIKPIEKVELAQEIIDEFQGQNEPRILGLAYLAKGVGLGQQGRLETAIETLTHAEAHGLKCTQAAPEIFFKARSNRALYMVAKGDKLDSARLLRELIEYAQPFPDKLNVAHPYLTLALLAENSGAVNKAIEYLQLSFETATNANDAFVAGAAGATIVEFLIAESQYELAEQWVEKALPWVEKSKDPGVLFAFSVRVEELRCKRGDPEKGAINLRKLAEEAPESFEPQRVGLAYMALSSAEHALKRYDLAIQAADEAITRLKEFPRSLYLVMQFRLESHFEQQKYESVVDEIARVLPATTQFPFPRIKLLDLQSRAFQKLNRHEEALEALRLCGIEESKRHKERAQEQMNFMTALFEDRERESRVALLNVQNTVLESQAKATEAKAEHQKLLAKQATQSRNTVIAFSLGALFLGSWIVRSYFRNRSSRVIAKRESELNEKLKHQLELQSQSLRKEVETRRKLELAVERKHRDEALGKLTGGVAHDFNNLLTVILNSNEIIRLKGEGLSDGVLELLEASTKSAQSGASIISQLLAYARQQALAPKQLRISAWLLSVRSLFRQALGDSIKFEIHDLSNDAAIQIDAAQLTTSIINLLCNSKDAITKNGRVDLLIQLVSIDASNADQWNDIGKGSYVMFEVRDNGIGIASEDLEHVCEPFYTTKNATSGTGLGLSSVQGFVKQSAGDFQLKSEPGQGTTVRFILPQSEKGETETLVAATEMPRLPKKILLVDDQDDVRFVTGARLSMMGFDVREANSADSAIQQLQNGKTPEIVLSDVRMPGTLDGVGLRSWIREHFPEIRVILMSGYDEPPETTANGFLKKPFSHQELEAILEMQVPMLEMQFASSEKK